MTMIKLFNSSEGFHDQCLIIHQLEVGNPLEQFLDIFRIVICAEEGIYSCQTWPLGLDKVDERLGKLLLEWVHFIADQYQVDAHTCNLLSEASHAESWSRFILELVCEADDPLLGSVLLVELFHCFC